MKRSWLAFGMVVLSAGCDPVHGDAVDALGGEAPGVPHGPTHRPGQPCLLCHDGAFGDPEKFSMAGTVYVHPSGDQPVNGATVTLTDATGSTYNAATNVAGNFYITPDQWTPTNPVSVVVTAPDGTRVRMQTNIGRDGSCAGSHVAPAGPSSPGRVCITLDDGGVPP